MRERSGHRALAGHVGFVGQAEALALALTQTRGGSLTIEPRLRTLQELRSPQGLLAPGPPDVCPIPRRKFLFSFLLWKKGKGKKKRKKKGGEEEGEEGEEGEEDDEADGQDTEAELATTED